LVSLVDNLKILKVEVNNRHCKLLFTNPNIHKRIYSPYDVLSAFSNKPNNITLNMGEYIWITPKRGCNPVKIKIVTNKGENTYDITE